MEAIANEIKDTFDRLVRVLERFDQSEIDTVPFEGSWTAGQVGEHIAKSISGIPKLVDGRSEPTRSRPFDAKAKMLREVFLDFSTQFKSPDFILPTASAHSKSTLIAGFEKKRSELMDIAQNRDLTVTLLDAQMPQSGHLTTFEWLTFVAVHTQRHTVQLEKILDWLRN